MQTLKEKLSLHSILEFLINKPITEFLVNKPITSTVKKITLNKFILYIYFGRHIPEMYNNMSYNEIINTRITGNTWKILYNHPLNYLKYIKDKKFEKYYNATINYKNKFTFKEFANFCKYNLLKNITVKYISDIFTVGVIERRYCIVNINGIEIPFQTTNAVFEYLNLV